MKYEDGIGVSLRRMGYWAWAVLAVGCAPSLRSKSAGFVGCAPGEITISGESASGGFGQDTSTWVAVCRGRRFICGETITRGSSTTYSPGGYNNNGYSPGATTTNSSASSEIHCSPEVDDSEPVAKSAPRPPVSARDRAPAPVGGGGFSFGMDGDAAKATCEGASQSWSSLADNKSMCSGPAIDMGFAAEVVVNFCKGALCGVAVEHRPKKNWIASFGELKGQLETKYGSPDPGSVPIVTPDCRADAELIGCIESESVRLRYTWTWPTGERMNLFFGKGDTRDGAPAIRLQYVKAPSAIKAKVNAL
jgi:hypothetical protein